MPSKKPEEINGIYLGKLKKEQAGNILNVIEQESIPSLKNTICDFPQDMVDISIKEKKSIRNLLREQGLQPQSYLGSLREEQTIGVGFLYYSPRSILGDGVGLGKTVEVAALLNLLDAKKELTRFLIAVENNAAEQVQRELIRFTGFNIARITKTGKALEKELGNIDWQDTRGLVISHSKLISEQMNRLLAVNIDEHGNSLIFNTFILDESSVVKNEKTQIYRAVVEICGIVDRVHFLNATAFEISIQDIYNQLDLLDNSILPKWWRFESEFCIMQRKGYWKTEAGRPVQKFARVIAGYKNQEVFRNRIKLFYLGRNVNHMDSGSVYTVEEVYPTEQQQTCIQQGHRFSEVLNCPALVPDTKINMDTDSVPKLKKLESLLLARKDKQVFIYCFNVKAQETIKSLAEGLGRRAEIINGTIAKDERQKRIDAFNCGEINTLISNIQRSMNLYGGDTCIYYTLEGNPARMEQIRGRIDRHIDDSKKEFILLLYKNTDEYNWLVHLARSRSQASSDLTVKSETAVDKFIDSMLIKGQIKDIKRKGDKFGETKVNDSGNSFDSFGTISL